MAKRLKLDGIAYRPAWFHTAYAGRYELHFADAERQRRFEALIRDLVHMGLLELSVAISEGRVLLNGEPYVWEPHLMVYWLHPPEPADNSDPTGEGGDSEPTATLVFTFTDGCP
jgi:hypothetical protein